MVQTGHIATGLRLRKVLPGIVHVSGVTAQLQAIPPGILAQCRDLGATLAAGLSAGIY